MTRLGVQMFSAPSGAVEAAETALGRPFSAASIYQKFDDATNWPTPDAVVAKAKGALIYLNINAVTDTGKGKAPASWSEIVGGQFDTMLLDWANALTTDAYGRMILTFAHEPNVQSTSQPKASDYDLTQYPALFDYVRELMQANGVVYKWAFMPTAGAYSGNKYQAFMPDPDHFDLLGSDLYGHASDTKTFEQKASPMMAVAESLGKRVLIGELGNDNPDKAAQDTWIETAAAYFLAQPQTAEGRDRVNAVSWNMKPEYGVVTAAGVNPVWVQAVQGYN